MIDQPDDLPGAPDDDEELWADDSLWDDGEILFMGYEELISRYLGYEIELSGSLPMRLRIVQPSTPQSSTVLVGVYGDCLVVQERDDYLLLPHAQVIVAIPKDEWESGEWRPTGE